MPGHPSGVQPQDSTTQQTKPQALESMIKPEQFAREQRRSFPALSQEKFPPIGLPPAVVPNSSHRTLSLEQKTLAEHMVVEQKTPTVDSTNSSDGTPSRDNQLLVDQEIPADELKASAATGSANPNQRTLSVDSKPTVEQEVDARIAPAATGSANPNQRTLSVDSKPTVEQEVDAQIAPAATGSAKPNQRTLSVDSKPTVEQEVDVNEPKSPAAVETISSHRMPSVDRKPSNEQEVDEQIAPVVAEAISSHRAHSVNRKLLAEQEVDKQKVSIVESTNSSDKALSEDEKLLVDQDVHVDERKTPAAEAAKPIHRKVSEDKLLVEQEQDEQIVPAVVASATSSHRTQPEGSKPLVEPEVDGPIVQDELKEQARVSDNHVEGQLIREVSRGNVSKCSYLLLWCCGCAICLEVVHGQLTLSQPYQNLEALLEAAPLSLRSEIFALSQP